MRQARPSVPAVLGAWILVGVTGFVVGVAAGEGGPGSPAAAAGTQPGAADLAMASGSRSDSPVAGAPAPASQPAAAFIPPTISLEADRRRASARQTITLTGSAPASLAGVRLVVQRRDGEQWKDIAATTSTDDAGAYRLWIRLGRLGDNVLRVAFAGGDVRSAPASKPVTVTIN